MENILKDRFEQNMQRHSDIKWKDVEAKLTPEKLKILKNMEDTGGEPDVVRYDAETDEYIFFDCSTESPKERRNVCYDEVALEARKKFKPRDSALNMAKTLGIEILSEGEYMYLQTLGEFDNKTSSWLLTPDEIRKWGGAIFADRRYKHVFIYHNGADSYYASRGFRGSLRV
jgi:hypothetical protein